MKRRLTMFAALACAFAGLGAAPGPPDAPVADAAMRGDVEAVRALVARGADVNAAQGDGMTALHWVARRGDAATAELLLLAGANPDAATRIGSYTPLHLATRAGAGDVVAKLVARGADPHARTTTTGVAPLHLAAAAGDVATITLLLDAGADPDVRETAWEQTPLTFAAANDRAQAIRTLVARGADPGLASRVRDYQQMEALEREAARRDGVVLRALRGGEAEPSADQLQAAVREARLVYERAEEEEDDEDEEEGDESAAGGGFRLFPRLIEKIGGLTPLLHAARQGHVDAVNALLDGGADIDQVSESDGTSPLLIASLNGQFDVAMALIDRGADPTLASELNGATPLWAAINSVWQPRTTYPQPQERATQAAGYLDLVEALLVAGADPNARLTKRPWYMIHNGCGSLDCGVVNLTGSTAFFRAAYATDLAAMRLLIAYGAEPQIATTSPPEGERIRLDDFLTDLIRDQARRALGAPNFSELADSVKIERLRNVRQELSEPEQLVFADDALQLDPDAAQTDLLAAIARADSIREATPDPSGLPPVPEGAPGIWPIHAASGAGYGEGFAGNSHRHAPDAWVPTVRYLVEELGADVNARDFNGYTPLHHAAARGDDELIRYLVRMGADVMAVSRYGETTVDMANGPVQRLSPFPETIALLESLGAKNNHNCLSC